MDLLRKLICVLRNKIQVKAPKTRESPGWGRKGRRRRKEYKYFLADVLMLTLFFHKKCLATSPSPVPSNWLSIIQWLARNVNVPAFSNVNYDRGDSFPSMS